MIIPNQDYILSPFAPKTGNVYLEILLMEK